MHDGEQRQGGRCFSYSEECSGSRCLSCMMYGGGVGGGGWGEKWEGEKEREEGGRREGDNTHKMTTGRGCELASTRTTSL